MTVSVEFFRQVPLFVDLSDELLGQLAREAGEVRLRAGEWLFREGDEADRLYLIRSGRLEVVDEGPPEILIRVLRRGEAVGELALLQGGTRTASVRVRRDADLIELSRDRFEALIAGEPSFAVGLTRAGMWWEALARAFWPLGVVLALVIAALAFGATELFSNALLIWVMGLVALAILMAGGWGLWRLSRPTLEGARARVDETLPGRPLAALRDDRP